MKALLTPDPLTVALRGKIREVIETLAHTRRNRNWPEDVVSLLTILYR
jgi:hypothetical protein